MNRKKIFDIITIFPEILDSYFSESLFKRAQKNKLLTITCHNLRQWANDRHQTVDDRPYGGGAGLVFKADVMAKAIQKIKKSPAYLASASITGRKNQKIKTRIILTAANGKTFTQQDAKRLSKYDRLIFICPRYEGIDARVEKMVDEKLSIGNYVLVGGELAAAVMIETVARYIPGFVGKDESVKNDSFSQAGYLEYPQYTRPEVVKFQSKKLKVPKILLSGNHAKIEAWRQTKSKKV